MAIKLHDESMQKEKKAKKYPMGDTGCGGSGT
jgi:hypothetical protein